MAFDTLYAEGQRRYVESLSSYARQFLGRMNKPEVDSISAIPPAIAVEQKTSNNNPRSTVGTMTEIYEYIKLLYVKIGKTFSPISNEEVKRDSVTSVVDKLLSFEESSKMNILSPIHLKEGQSLEQRLKLLLELGYSRIEHNGNILQIEDVLEDEKFLKNNKPKKEDISILIDRVILKHDAQDMSLRLSDSIHTAFWESDGEAIVEVNGKKIYFSNRFEKDGMTFIKPSENFFSFNNPYGACSSCSGTGSIIDISEDLVITNPNLSVYEGVVNCWRGEIMKKFKEDFINKANKIFPIHRPYIKLSEKEKDLLWNGDKEIVGINQFFHMLEKESYKIQFRVMLSRYRGKTTCPKCKGTRLREDAQYVKVNGKSIVDLLLMPIDELIVFFKNIILSDYELNVTQRLLTEINQRLQYMQDVGLSYLTLNRQASSLSGGESQRIALATSLGSPLVGSMYILDEPSIGLHPKDTNRLINVLLALRDAGNSVIVVEHDEEIIKNADFIIDIGPLSGSFGGEVVFSGKYSDLLKNKTSLTAKYINGEMSIPYPKTRRKWKEKLIIEHCNENNLKDITLTLPLNVISVVCGVSGSGKTTLIKNILFNSINAYLGEVVENIPKSSPLKGSTTMIKSVLLVDQNPIGRSSRSNCVTYLGAFDDIRNLFAQQPLAERRHIKAGFFSFNIEGGRCDKCKGEGVITIPMQFMADVFLQCDKCKGRRYNEDALEIKYNGKNIADILDMSVDDAINFFQKDSQNITMRIANKLKALQKVGLGYLLLGQSSTTLSGGEAQRVKLAYYLSKENTDKPTLFIFDEPSTGLHFYDIEKLNIAFEELIALGHSIVIIEHHPDIIKIADWIIELGPSGGKNGGEITFEGTPEDMIKNNNTQTGEFIREKLLLQ